jgi:hypothetical protein
MTQQLIETVAQAMHGNRYEWPRPEFAEHREDYRKEAKRAILATLEAIREPSNTMRLAGRVHEPGTVDDPFNLIPGAVWRAMIDALRAETESAE